MSAFEVVTITKKEYEALLWKADCLDFLHGRGVDNWHGYGIPPSREDFDTDEEYAAAWDKAVENY